MWLLAVCLVFMFPLVCFSEPSGWTAGFSIASEGFISEIISNESEYVGLNLFVEPWNFKFLTPSFSAGVIIPAAPLDIASGMITAELGAELFALMRHPFSGLLDLENAYCPLVSFRIMAPFAGFAPESWYLSAVLSPFRLKTGSGRFSIMSLAYIASSDLSYAGWGLRLFDIRLFLL
jgi:hypothetical protein